MPAVSAAASSAPSQLVPAGAGSFLSSVFAPIHTLSSAASVGWGWLSRHKKEVGIGVAVTTAVAGYYVYSKVQPMIAQFRAELQQIEQITAQMNPQAQPQQKHAIMLHRLEHNLTVGDVTLRQFAQTVRKDVRRTTAHRARAIEAWNQSCIAHLLSLCLCCAFVQLMSRFDVDEIRSRLKKSSSSSGRSASDYLLWDEFKVAGFSRTLSSLYVMCMLHALIKLQLSIVSRYVLFDQQAQQQRQETEAAEQLQRGGQPAAPAAPESSGPFAQPPTFLPPPVCEEVNRVYFSLSRHAQSVGAAQLADHIASLVRQELAPWKALAGQVTRVELQSALNHIQERVQSEALGLESKTDMEARSGEPTENAASAAGASASTTVYTSPNTYVRFLLPNSAGLSSLVGSTSFPDPHINNMASFRLAEMVAETNAVVNSGAFQCALAASFAACLGEMERLLAPAFSPAAARNLAAGSSSAAPADETTDAPIPFANVSPLPRVLARSFVVIFCSRADRVSLCVLCAGVRLWCLRSSCSTFFCPTFPRASAPPQHPRSHRHSSTSSQIYLRSKRCAL